MSSDDLKAALNAGAQKIGGPAGAHEPDWAPLENVLPMEECGGFMFMGYAEAYDGTSVRMYKHGITRRYLNLDEQSRPYSYAPHLQRAFNDPKRGYYVRMAGGRPQDILETAINNAFSGLEEMGETRSTAYSAEFRAQRDAALVAAGWTVISPNLGKRP